MYALLGLKEHSALVRHLRVGGLYALGDGLQLCLVDTKNGSDGEMACRKAGIICTGRRDGAAAAKPIVWLLLPSSPHVRDVVSEVQQHCVHRGAQRGNVEYMYLLYLCVCMSTYIEQLTLW